MRARYSYWEEVVNVYEVELEVPDDVSEDELYDYFSELRESSPDFYEEFCRLERADVVDSGLDVIDFAN